MSNDQLGFYRPYDSEDEDDDLKSHGDTSVATSMESENTEFDRFEDPRYAIIRAAGPRFTTMKKEYEYGIGLNSAIYEAPDAETYTNSVFYKSPKKNILTSLFSIKSTNRDQSVYPTSANFTLKLPRTYKNVTQVRCVQLTFPFYQNAIMNPSSLTSTTVNYMENNFSPEVFSACVACVETYAGTYSLQYHELGRKNPAQIAYNLSTCSIEAMSSITEKLCLVTRVRNGGYTPDGLVAELNKQVNTTPPFNLITYAEHAAIFNATRTVDHLFNYPGQYVYDPTTNRFTESIERADLVNLYFPNTFTFNPTIPSEKETFNAYYYPVLKQAILDPAYNHYLNVSSTGVSFSTLYKRVVNFFEGFDSDLYYTACSTNFNFLNTLRRRFTFEYFPIMKYNWYYDINNNRIGVTFNTLSQSIIDDINYYNANCINDALNQLGLNQADFLTLQTSAQQAGAIVQDLYNVFCEGISYGLGIPYGYYSTPVLANPSSIIYTSSPTWLQDYQKVSTSKNLLEIALGQTVLSTPGTYTPPTIPYTYGFIQLNSGLVNLVYQSSDYLINPANYTAEYISSLSTLNGKTTLNRYVGNELVPAYGGEYTITNNFTQFYSTYTGRYNIYLSTVNTISTVTGCSKTSLYDYVNRKYCTVFPPELLNNISNGYLNTIDTSVDTEIFLNNKINRQSSPFETYTISEKLACSQLASYIYNVFYQDVPQKYVFNSLPCRIGMIGPVYTNVSSITKDYNYICDYSPLVTQNTYLQINTQQSFNAMDVAGDENYMLTNETTGQTKFVLGKILTPGLSFLGISQTIIQHPALFSPPLGKLDRLEFTMIQDDMMPLSVLFPFNYDYTNWDAVFQIDEEVAQIDRPDVSVAPNIPLKKGGLPF